MTAGVLGSIIAKLFGGWDSALSTLIIFMAIDYITGLIVAGIFHKSKKSDNGALESEAGLKGLCKKGVMLLVVLVAYRLDIVTGLDFIRDAAIIAFIANEAISIVENAGLMGVPMPKAVMKAVDILKERSEEEEGQGTDPGLDNGGQGTDPGPSASYRTGDSPQSPRHTEREERGAGRTGDRPRSR